MRNLFTLGREGTTKLGSPRTRIQTRFETFQLSRKRVADGGEFYDLTMNERERERDIYKIEKEEKKITTKYI